MPPTSEPIQPIIGTMASRLPIHAAVREKNAATLKAWPKFFFAPKVGASASTMKANT